LTTGEIRFLNDREKREIAKSKNVLPTIDQFTLSKFTDNASSMSLGDSIGVQANKFKGTDREIKQKVLRCPNGFFAVGIIGSTLGNTVGRFGLICMPLVDLSLSPSNYPFEKAVVVSGGSLDTGSEVSENVPFNDYITNVMSWGVLGPPQKIFVESTGHGGNVGFTFEQLKGRTVVQQNFAMCPPGFYLSGLTGYHGKFQEDGNQQLLGAIESLKCINPYDNTVVDWPIYHPFSRGEIFRNRLTQQEVQTKIKLSNAIGVLPKNHARFNKSLQKRSIEVQGLNSKGTIVNGLVNGMRIVWSRSTHGITLLGKYRS